MTVDTASWKLLDERDRRGICDGKTYPDEFDSRQADKLRYRYPCGESYEDVISRLQPVIIERGSASRSSDS